MHIRIFSKGPSPATPPLRILCYPLQVALELITYYKSYHGLTLCLAYNLPRSDLLPLCLRSALKVKFKMSTKLLRQVVVYRTQIKYFCGLYVEMIGFYFMTAGKILRAVPYIQQKIVDP